MKNISEPTVLAEINSRIDKLNADTPRQWGTMEPAQMLWHCRQQLNLGTGELKVKHLVPAPLRWVLKKTLGGRVPFSKGMGTVPGIEANEKVGLNFENEKTALKTALSNFVRLPSDAIVKTHPFFGTMNDKDWGQIIYKHLDHHLRQFGV
ncbi:MAG: DUF1569 domain-containing protein [Bacteroidia bacterium]